MVRLFSRLRQRSPAPPSPPARQKLPPPGVLRRERRALLKVREERLRDLGGLMLEMYRQDRFREDFLHERCLELDELDERLYELQMLLGAGHAPLGGRCTCGAPLVRGSHFCANCGRPAGEAAVLACEVCGHALPADAAFCAGCGSPAGAALPEPDESDEEAEPAAEPLER
jgi:predicted amidophosphoribosyltransferase